MCRFFKLLCMTLCATMAFVACDKPQDVAVPPSVELSLIDVTDHSVTFSVTTTAADECRYIFYDGDVITAERVLSEGYAIEGSAQERKVNNLESQTTYYIIAAARNASGVTLSEPLEFTTPKQEQGTIAPPDDPDARTINIVKSTSGRWYEIYNYYVTLVAESGEHIVLDFYTLDETMSSYLPYGNYLIGDTFNPFTLGAEYSGIFFNPGTDDEIGYNFTEGSCLVDVKDGKYCLTFYLTYEVEGTPYKIQGYYHGQLSGASIPKGDDVGQESLIEVLEVGSTSFKFRINAEEGQYWRCSVVEKRVYDQQISNPGAWVVNYGFMLEGTLTFDWVHGEVCEHVPGYVMNVASSTDYLILAALMDYSEAGNEYDLLGGVEIAQLRTEAEAAGTGTVDIVIKEVNVNDIVFDCTLNEGVWCCYVAILETEVLDEIKAGRYQTIGYNSYEECMSSLIPTLSDDSMRQFMTSQLDYKWNYLNYNTNYTMCVKVVDMNNGANYFELEPFTTKK